MLTPLLNDFLTALEGQGVSRSQWQSYDGPPLSLGIPATHVDVGAISVIDNDTELIVVLGNKFHSHFDTAQEAAELVVDFISEKVGVAVHYLDCKCIGASLVKLAGVGIMPADWEQSSEGIYGGNIRTERFLWSGPVGNPGCE